MKKLLYVLCLLLAVSVIFTACKKNKGDEGDTPDTNDEVISGNENEGTSPDTPTNPDTPAIPDKT